MYTPLLYKIPFNCLKRKYQNNSEFPMLIIKTNEVMNVGYLIVSSRVSEKGISLSKRDIETKGGNE